MGEVETVNDVMTSTLDSFETKLHDVSILRAFLCLRESFETDWNSVLLERA